VPIVAGYRSRLVAEARSVRFGGIWVATALLFAFSPLVASGSLGSAALLANVFPFASILAIAAIGQTLVIQQRGLDLSVPTMISLTALLITKYSGDMWSAVGWVLLACVASGLISGLAITRLGITPLVATLGVSALLQATIYQLTSGTATSAATPGLSSFALQRYFWGKVPSTVIVAVLALAAVTVVIRSTVVGRRFVAVGANPVAARAAGIRVRNYELFTYVIASLVYGGAGILLAGFVRTPNFGVGNDYLLPSIAAVVLGGTALAGGRGSVIATAVGALFLTQLEVLILESNLFNGRYEQAVRFTIQGSIIALGMALRNVPLARLRGWAGQAKRPFVRDLPGARPLAAGRTELPEGSDQ
jgi:ribose transport system permease protein